MKNIKTKEELQIEISQLETKISELKKVEEKLKESEDKYRTLFESSATPIWLEDFSDIKAEFDKLKKEGVKDFKKYYDQHPEEVARMSRLIKVTDVNQSSVELMGAKDKETLKKSIPLYFTEESLIVFREELIVLAHGKDKFKGEIPIINQLGKEVFLGISLSVPKESMNSFDRLIFSFYNITERRQAETELNEAKERAEESDRLKSAFLTNVSHEIRTPMNGILGFAELLKEPGLTGEKQEEFISIIEKSGERMLNIINDIIDISKIESGLMEVNIQETNINKQIDFIETFFKPEIEGKGMRFLIKKPLAEKESFIKSDSAKIYGILTNLVKNAIKFTEEGTIELGYALKTGNESSELEFYVKDTGIGVPKDRQIAIFERFVQADITNKMAYQGAGLGLSISKAYVEILGGKIWMESEEGKGSIFYFTLPYRTEPEEKIVAKNEDWSGKTEGKVNPEGLGLKILITEDDKVSKIILSAIIKEYSKAVLEASTGIEAVDICRNNPDIDLILMDIQMPGLNGYDATLQIRQFNKDVIIIAQTAFALIGDKEKAIEAGCNDYISKPIKKAELLALVQKHFKK